MPQPASTLRLLRSRSERKGRGASLLEDSHNGNTTRQTPPMTIMASMLGLCQWLFAVAAKVRGIKIKAKAAESNKSPITSSSYHKCLRPPITLWPFHGDGGRRRSLATFLIFKNSARASGMKAVGKMIVQSPYPHLQVVWANRLLAIGGPTQTVTRKGTSGRLENSALLRRSLVSATNICINICKPVDPAE